MNEQQNPNDYPGMILTEESKHYLVQTAKWARFLAIVGFVMVGFLVIVAFFAGAFLAALDSDEELSAIGTGSLTALYLVLAIVYFFPVWYLFRFANRTREAIKDEDSELLAAGLEQLKACIKFVGILTIIVLVFYFLAIFALLFTGFPGF